MVEQADNQALYISIGEAARLVGVSRATLRAWEARGLVQPDRSSAGYRRYTLADVERLTRLRQGQGGDGATGSVANGPAAPESTVPPWGQRLREQRESHGLSLRRVSALTGLSASFISGIERGIANPSVAALQKLTAAYGVSIVDLMEARSPVRGRLIRVVDRQRYDAADGVIMDQLNFGEHMMELHLFTVEPGAGTGGTFHHEGEEFIMLLEGTLVVTLDALEQYVLNPGDVLYFESFHRHEWTNPGQHPAVFLGVNTPRTF
ncbi:MAG: helix-turn-helix domain-containing protein [Thermomicrobiales bacterium]|nr:helix-turn-helix domain-containing protein [Thermomicrobiales bacterium]